MRSAKMSANPRAVYDEVAAKLAATTPATPGKMFGFPVLKSNGKVFAGFYQDSMVFKLDGLARAEALSLTGARIFHPTGWRSMKEWVEVPAEHAEKWGELALQAQACVATNG